MTSSGALAFTYAHNFEDPQDQNKDNVYEVNVRVNDIEHVINTSVQTLHVTVNDVDDAPANVMVSSTSATTVSVNDGTTIFFIPVNTVSYENVIATPSPSNGALTFAIMSNPDNSIFSMTSNGELKIDAPPLNSTTTYELTVKVSESKGESSLQVLNVTILD